MQPKETVRIGILGAARIAPLAVVRPARDVDEASVVAVAARDRRRAESFASKHAIANVAAGYRALLDDPDVDAVYNPLPNALHAEWTIAALEAGKHVLCEKPFTANADEARKVAAAAERSDRVVMEAFHYRYHPLAGKMASAVHSGELGRLTRVDAWMGFPLPVFSDIRYNLELAGGAMMDAGCYTVNLVRFLAGAEPEVVRAKAKLQRPEVDRAMSAELRFPGGCTGRVRASMLSTSPLLGFGVRVTGDLGEMKVFNPVSPQFFHSMSVRSGGRRRVERGRGRPTYEYQLRAFCGAVLRGEPVLTPPSDAVKNMEVIDAVYLAAGLHPRGSPLA